MVYLASLVFSLGSTCHFRVCSELKTHLNTILGSLEFISNDALTSSQIDSLQAAIVSGEQMSSLVNQFLDYARWEVGSLTLVPTVFSVRQCIQEILNDLGPACKWKNIDFSADVSLIVPDRVVGDERRSLCAFQSHLFLLPMSCTCGSFRLFLRILCRVRQIIFNLVLNAIKQCDRGFIAILVSLVPLRSQKPESTVPAASVPAVSVDPPSSGTAADLPDFICPDDTLQLRIDVVDSGPVVPLLKKHGKLSFRPADTVQQSSDGNAASMD